MIWSAITVLGTLANSLFGYYVTGKKTREDLDAAFNQWAQLKGRTNESADDRESVDQQHERIAKDRMDALMKDLDKEMKIVVKDEVAKKEITAAGSGTAPIETPPSSAHDKPDTKV